MVVATPSTNRLGTLDSGAAVNLTLPRFSILQGQFVTGTISTNSTTIVPHKATFGFTVSAGFISSNTNALLMATITTAPNPCVFDFSSNTRKTSCTLTINIPLGISPGTYIVTVTYVNDSGHPFTLGTFKITVMSNETPPLPALGLLVTPSSPSVGGTATAYSP